MTVDNSNEEKKPVVWEIVQLSDFELPTPPVRQQVKKQLRFVQNLFKNEKKEQEGAFVQALELELLPAWKLDRIAPRLDWGNGVDQFHQKILDWLENKSSYNHEIITFIGPPFSGYDEILRNWAARQDLACLMPPKAEQIFSEDRSWFENPNEDKIWIFPNLERAFFRHTEGLNLIRDFLDKAFSGALGKGIIGCNSWTWAYLSYIWHGKFPYTFTLQAFDHKRLTKVFHSLSKKSSSREYVFRQSNDGKYVIPENYPAQDSREESDFLQSLAAYSRGNLGIAYDFWYESPRLEPDKVLSEEEENSEESQSKLTVWITPWNQLLKPKVPIGSKIENAIILHMLLIHNGLPTEVIEKLVPFSSSQIMETLLILEEAKILVLIEGRWTIKSTAYPVVREFVHLNDYLIDKF